MFERFSQEARYVLVLAKYEAERFKHTHIGTEHILVALTHEHTNAAQVLAAAGVTAENARRQIVELVGYGTTPSPGHLPFTENTRQILDEATRASLRLGHEHIGTEHLLLAITSGPCTGLRALVRSGGDPEKVAQQIEQAVSATTSQAKEPLDIQVTDTSIGHQHLTDTITRTARTAIPQDRRPARDTILQAVVVSAPLEKDCLATVSALNDQFAWTQLLSLPFSEWEERIPQPSPGKDRPGQELTDLGDELIARAVKVLGA